MRARARRAWRPARTAWPGGLHRRLERPVAPRHADSMPMPITTAVASGVFHAVSIRMPASLPSSSRTSFGHFSAGRADGVSGRRASASSTAVPTARLRPDSPSMRPLQHAADRHQQRIARFGEPRAAAPSAPRGLRIRDAGERRWRCVARRAEARATAPSRSAFVEPVSSTISMVQSRAGRSASVASRVRSMRQGASGAKGVEFMADIVAARWGFFAAETLAL